MKKNVSAIHKFYVHYRALDYLNQEHQSKNFPFYTYAQKKAMQLANRSSLKSGISSQQKEDYLTAINAIMGRSTNTSNLNSQLLTHEQQRVNNIIEAKLQKALTVDKISGKVAKMLSTGNLKLPSKTSKPNQQKEAISDTRLQQLLQEITNIKKQVEKELKQGATDLSNDISIARLSEIEMELQRMIDSAEELVKKDAQGTTIGYLRPYAALHKNKKWYMRTSKEAEWISNVDMLIKQCRISDRAASLAQGDYFEEVAAAAARLCVGSAENWLVDAITGAVQSFVGKAVGHRREAMHFRLDGMNLKEYERVFAQRLTEQQIQTDGKGNRYMVINDYSQGKIDVEAFFPVYQGGQFKNLQPVTISAKSYSDLSSLGAVSGTSLWTFLQNENTYFIKAYLNVMADHMAVIEEKAWSVSYENNSIRTLLRQRGDAVASMKILAAYRALTGDTMGRKTAQLLLINDVSKSRVHLVEMADIFSRILTQTKTDRTAIGRYFNFAQTIDVMNTYPNNWHPDGAGARVGDLIAAVHAHKISIAFKPKAILSDPTITMTR